jgi:hypothetical protein
LLFSFNVKLETMPVVKKIQNSLRFKMKTNLVRSIKNGSLLKSLFS